MGGCHGHKYCCKIKIPNNTPSCKQQKNQITWLWRGGLPWGQLLLQVPWIWWRERGRADPEPGKYKHYIYSATLYWDSRDCSHHGCKLPVSFNSRRLVIFAHLVSHNLDKYTDLNTSKAWQINKYKLSHDLGKCTNWNTITALTSTQVQIHIKLGK